MNVCAHYYVGGSTWHVRHRSIRDAVADLRTAHDAMGFDTIPGVQASAMTYNHQCDDCISTENHHDYPLGMYAIGVRGGISKEYV